MDLLANTSENKFIKNYLKGGTNMEHTIKDFNKIKDIDLIMKIWLNSNLQAHDFISDRYWIENYDEVKKLLPQSHLRVYWKDEQPIGFIGIVDGYIAGVFVDSNYRCQGIGLALLEDAKKQYNKLSLDVYEKNQGAFRFYKRNGFQKVSSKVDDINKEIEYHMIWKKK